MKEKNSFIANRALLGKALIYVIHKPTSVFGYLKESRRLRENMLFPFTAPDGAEFFTNPEELLIFQFGHEVLSLINDGTIIELKKIYDENLLKIKELYGDRSLSILSFDEAMCLYFTVLSNKPKTVVETGVSDGMSTLFILLALRRNGTESLYSIDYPEVGMPAIYGKKPGWIVPESLKSHWHLMYGKSREKLPKLLNQLKSIDIFLHDSEHSDSNMKFEFNIALNHMHNNSIIISDDVTSNRAFTDSLSLSGIEFKAGFLKNDGSDFALAIIIDRDHFLCAK